MTGASGNIGAALLHRLAQQPDVEVHGLARRDPGPAVPADAWTTLDLSTVAPGRPNRRRLREVVDGADAVVHLAWKFQSAHDIAVMEQTNLVGTGALLEAVRAARVPHLIHLSSLAAYSPGPKRAVDESWPVDGIASSPYSRHKAIVERKLDGTAAPGTTITRVRPALVAQRSAARTLVGHFLPGFLPPQLLTAVPVLPLPNAAVGQIVHTDDVAAALVTLLREPRPGAFNLAADPPLGPRQLAEITQARHVPVSVAAVRAAGHAAWLARLHPTDVGWLDVVFRSPLLDSSRASDELGFRPTRTPRAVVTELLEGLRGDEQAPTAADRHPAATRRRPD